MRAIVSISDSVDRPAAVMADAVSGATTVLGATVLLGDDALVAFA